MIVELEETYKKLKDQLDQGMDVQDDLARLLEEGKKNLRPYDRLYLARHIQRPKAEDFIIHLIKDRIYLRGDRAYGEDKSITAGVGMYKGRPVSFIGTRKGRNTEENIEYNFGMPNPEGYRKVQRLMAQSQKFKRPLLSFIDTSGAYPGKGAEERGQGEAIAKCLEMSFDLEVPVISIITGEGGSGGALALGVGNSIIMFENSIYSILSPEGFASILWKDASRAEEASEIMKFTGKDLKDLGIIDVLVEEDIAFSKEDFNGNMQRLDEALEKELDRYSRWSKDKIKDHRKGKFRRF